LCTVEVFENALLKSVIFTVISNSHIRHAYLHSYNPLQRRAHCPIKIVLKPTKAKTGETAMSKTIRLDRNQVPSALRQGYNGNKFSVVICETVTIPADAGNWGGGSRETWSAVRIADGATVPVSDNMSAPWDSSRRDKVVTLTPDIAVIEHSIFLGKDVGLRIYICPAAAAPMLPAPVAELPPVEMLVLEYTSSRKSSYNGQDRCAMALNDQRWNKNPITFTRADWNVAKENLIGRGLLNKAGAITTRGRNAVTER
jgi:hypothetical protein